MRKNRELKISFPKEEKKKKISISTFIIILGTIVGIYLGINKIYYNRVIFGFRTGAVQQGTLSIGNSKEIYLMLIGTATNKGNKPLNPHRFDLSVKVEGEWIPLQKMIIPQGFKLKGGTEDAAENDLQKWSQPITIEEPARGNLMFRSNELVAKSVKATNSIIFQLICVDIFNKKHTFTTTYGPFPDIDRRGKLIKHDVIIEPKDY